MDKDLIPFVLAGLATVALLYAGGALLESSWKRLVQPMSKGRKVALVLLLVLGGVMFLLGLIMAPCIWAYEAG